MNVRRRSSLARRIFLINGIVLAVLAVAAGSLNAALRRQAAAAFADDQSRSLINVADVFQNTLEEVYALTSAFAQSQEIDGLLIAPGREPLRGDLEVRVYRALRLLRLVRSSRPDIDDIYVLSPSAGRLLYSEGSVPSSFAFAGSALPTDQQGPAVSRNAFPPRIDFRLEFIEGSAPPVFPTEPRSYVTYRTRDIVIGAGLDQDAMVNSLERLLLHESDVVVVSAPDGTVLLTNAETDALAQSIVSAVGEYQTDGTSESFSSADGEYRVIATHRAVGSRFPVIYHVASRTDALFVDLGRANRLTLLMVALLSIVQIAIFLFLRFRIYVPLRSIVSRFSSGDDQVVGDEYEILRRVLDGAVAAGFVADERELAAGIEPNQLQQAFARLGHTQAPFVAVALVVEDEQGAYKRETAVGIREVIRQSFSISVVADATKEIVWLVSVPDGSRSGLARALRDAVPDDTFVTSGISRAFHHRSEIQSAIESSHEALLRSRTQIRSSVNIGHPIGMGPGGFDLDVEDQRRFAGALLNGEQEAADRLLIRIVESNLNQPYSAIRELFRYLANILIVVLHTKRVDVQTVFGDRPAPTLEQISELWAPSLLLNTVVAACALVCAEVRASAGDLASEVERYVRTNYADVNLSVEGIAEALSRSPAYVSHAFRQQTGRRLLSFLHEVRVEEAKRLLRETELAPAEVAHAVGFGTYNTFRRVFRQLVGSGPKQFMDGRM